MHLAPDLQKEITKNFATISVNLEHTIAFIVTRINKISINTV